MSLPTDPPADVRARSRLAAAVAVLAALAVLLVAGLWLATGRDGSGSSVNGGEAGPTATGVGGPTATGGSFTEGPVIDGSSDGSSDDGPSGDDPTADDPTADGPAGDGEGGDGDGQVGATASGDGAGCHVSDDGMTWHQVFADDFDREQLDRSAWYVYDSEGNAGYGLRRPSAVSLEDGLLVITASMIDGQLVSGGMANSLDQVYGRWEARVRTDADPSAATSGVILTWPQSGNWPIDGENNIYETGPLPDRTFFSSFVHYGADNHHVEVTHQIDATEWHDVAMEWRDDRIRFFVDGRPSGEVTRPEAIPHVAHHLTIQLDAWSHAMGQPVRMEVDHVRVYAPSDGARCPG